MEVVDTAIPEVKIFKPRVFGDDRGYFFESFRDDSYLKHLPNRPFVQENESKSSFGVLRGLHYQKGEYAQAKLVRVVKGSVLDVVVDIRLDSPTFGQHVAVELTGDNKYQLYVPRGFAHGFVTLSEEAIFSYKCDNYYAPEHEAGIAFDDKDLNIDWRLESSQYLLSEKDAKNKSLKEL
jgi:dTDP-4-dehydrorhamnose 3,5-epimerase